MTTEDLADYPPSSCDACGNELTDEESSAVDGARKADQICTACREATCDWCGLAVGIRDMAWDADRAVHLCSECEAKANKPTRREIEEERADALYDQAKDDRMERERK